MTLKHFSGGGSLKVPTGPHTVDGDTVAHWSFDETGACAVTSPGQDFAIAEPDLQYWDVGQGTGRFCLIDGSSHWSRNGVSAGHVAALDFEGATACTVAFCARFSTMGAPVVKLSNDAGGFTEKFVLGVVDAAVDRIEYGHAISGSVYEIATHTGGSGDSGKPAIPKHEWCWIACVRNADGKSGKIRVRSREYTEDVTWTTTAVSVSNDTARWSVNNAWNNGRNDAQVYSLIIKDIACSDAQLDAMAAQCGF